MAFPIYFYNFLPQVPHTIPLTYFLSTPFSRSGSSALIPLNLRKNINFKTFCIKYPFGRRCVFLFPI